MPTPHASESQAQGWGLLGAPRMQVFALLCPRCGEPIRIIAFVTDVGSIRRILPTLGEPAQAPCIARAARGSPWEESFDPGAGTVLSERAASESQGQEAALVEDATTGRRRPIQGWNALRP